MTNIEIMRASLLDIIFDRRNKEYGAYALRRDYSKRLMIALGISLLLFFLIFLLCFFSANKKAGATIEPGENMVVMKTIELPSVAPKAPEIPRIQPKASQPRSTENVTAFKIEKDINVKVKDVVDLAELNKDISTIPNDNTGNGSKSGAENFAPKTDG